MKKALSIILAILILCISLSACASISELLNTPMSVLKNTGSKAVEANVSASIHAQYMISDDENIYFCPPEPLYSYGNYFGYTENMINSFTSSLWSIPSEYALTEPLAHGTVLVEGNCGWLTLKDGYIYFVNKDENAICRVSKYGGETELLYQTDIVGGEITDLVCIDKYIYFVQDTMLIRIQPDKTDAAAETVFEINEKFYDFAESADANCISESYAAGVDMHLYGFEYYAGKIYQVIRCDSYDEKYALISIDINDKNFSYNLFADDTSDFIALCGGKLYYQLVNGTNEFGDNVYALMAFDGKEHIDTFKEFDSRALMSFNDTLYYDSYINNVDSYLDSFEETGEEPAYDMLDGRYIFSYTEENGEQMIDSPIDIMYIMGVANNVIWFENFEDNVWMSADGSEFVHLSTAPYTEPAAEEPEQEPENDVPAYEAAYGPGVAKLDLDADELSACFRLLRTDGTEQFRVFLNPNESTTQSFPSGNYVLKIAEGTNWISDTEAFGPDGHYSSTNTYFFEAGGHYYIGAGTTGDFHNEGAGGFLG